jgi:hypothetical protein
VSVRHLKHVFARGIMNGPAGARILRIYILHDEVFSKQPLVLCSYRHRAQERAVIEGKKSLVRR